MNKVVKLIECIQSWQGEGPYVGRRSLILRFKDCDRVDNSKTCMWCDTLLKMRLMSETEYKLQDIQNIIDSQKVGLMITGGEPSYDKNFDATVAMLTKLKYPYADIESNGYHLLELLNVLKDKELGGPVNFMYSPKFFSEKELQEEIERTNDLVKQTFLEVYIKLVVTDSPLVTKYLEYLYEIGGINKYVYLMPQGSNRSLLIVNSGIVFKAAKKYKFNFSSREHIIYDFI